MDAKTALDVCRLPPARRHSLIMQTVEALHPGDAYILVNDHDPTLLYCQFTWEREGQFIWRGRIGRIGSSWREDSPACS